MDLMYCADFDVSLQELIECDLKADIENSDLMSELASAPLLSSDDDMDNLDHQFLDPYSLTLGYGLGGTSSLLRTSHPFANKYYITGAGLNSCSNISFDEQYIMVDPSSIVPNSVSSSLGSTGSASETELGTDEDEDDAELASQGWIITKAEGPESPTPSPVRVMQDVEYELIEEPEFVMESEPPVVEGPPQKKRKHKHEPQPHTDGKIYPKPGFSYSCLIAMSLKNSTKGSLPVSEIYKFMCDHFPYFKSAPSGWKNSVRHNLSLNKCFEKIEKPGGNAARKGCLWGLCRGKENKMDEEVQKWLKKDPGSVIRAMSDPENLELIERGELKRDYSGNTAGASDDEEEEEDAVTPIRVVAAPRSKVRPASTAATLTTAVVNGETIITTTPLTMSTLRTSLQPQQIRVIKTEGGEQGAVTDDQKQTIELAQLGSVQGNYLCHPNGTFTLSFTGLGNQSTRPLIIRHAQVK